MRRREFISLFGSVAAMSSLPARAQQADRVRHIGVIMALASDDPEAQARLAAFRQALQDLGWSAGHNVQFDYRWGVGDFELNRKNAAELVGLAPDVILATGTPTLEPLLRATHTVPIVFVQVPDPVGAGMVESLSRPGGNATGFFNSDYDLAGKWLELAQGDRTEGDACRADSGFHDHRGGWAVGCIAGRLLDLWCGVTSGRRVEPR